MNILSGSLNNKMIDKNEENNELNEANKDDNKNKSDSYKKDTKNIIFLMFLYFLQCVPLGRRFTMHNLYLIKFNH